MEKPSGDGRHRYYEELAVSHVLGGLSESDGRVFRSHLLECGECRARVGELRRIAHDLADVERDERRVRAAKSVETKRREADEDEVDPVEPAPSAQRPRVAVLLTALLVIGLAGWNFYLRSSLNLQGGNIAALRIENDLLLRGTRATPESLTEGSLPSSSPTQVRYDDDYVLVALDGVEDGERYALYQLNVRDQPLSQPREQRAVGDTMVLLGNRGPGATQIVVTRLRDGQRASSQDVSGDKYLEAELTAAAP